MKVAIFVPAFPVVSEAYIVRQMARLIDLGHNVDIYAEWHIEGGPVHREVAEYRLEARTTFVGVTPKSRLRRRLRAAIAILVTLVTVPRTALYVLSREYGTARGASLHWLASLRSHRKRYDVVHVHFGTLANRLRFMPRLWRVPLIVSFHGLEFALGAQSGHDVYKSLFAIADAVTAGSDHALMRLREFGCPEEKVYKLPNGVDPDRFPFRERALSPGEPVRLLTIARLVEKKGLEYAIRAVAVVVATHPHVRYDIVGGNGLRATLEELIQELNLSGIVTLHGAQDGAHIHNLLARAHVFMLTSVTAVSGDQETQGIALLEAQASGLPVVVTQHDGLPESIVPDVSGFLVPERDVDALAGQLRHLIAHPEIWPTMGRAGRRYVQECFDIRTLSERLIQVYEEIVARHC